jgi:hypothetical protein
MERLSHSRILKWNFGNYNEGVWIGCIWLGNFFTSWLLAPQVGLCSIQLDVNEFGHTEETLCNVRLFCRSDLYCWYFIYIFLVLFLYYCHFLCISMFIHYVYTVDYLRAHRSVLVRTLQDLRPMQSGLYPMSGSNSDKGITVWTAVAQSV